MKMRILDRTIRLALSAPFILFGISKFQAFMPTPPMTSEAARFIGALVETGYLWQFVGALEIAGGILILLNRFVLHGMALLVPVMVNILAYLLILQQGIGPAPYVMSLFLVSATAFLLWNRRKSWLPLWFSRSA